MPESKMPQVEVELPYTPSTYNDPEFTEAVMAGFGERFGAENVKKVPSVMGGEDFSQFKRAAPDDVQSLIFWVGGVRPGEFARAEEIGGASWRERVCASV